jgi:hypothetical protein
MAPARATPRAPRIEKGGAPDPSGAPPGVKFALFGR